MQRGGLLAGGLALVEVRITSYNVCYTKLLRFLLILSYVAETLRMIVVGRIIENLQTVWVVAFIIIGRQLFREGLL